MKVKYSVILPAYNETGCLAASLNTVKSYLDSTGETFEIILVDDGSKDDTRSIAESLAKDIPELRVISNAQNHGKGYVVRQGMLAAEGEYRLFCDTDLAVPVHQLDMLVAEMEKGHDVAIGSRYLDKDSPKHTAWYRRLMGWGFNIVVRLTTSLSFKDTQCGFKCFSAESAGTIFSRMTLTGFSFDVEALWLAQMMGFKIVEVPIDWWSKHETKVNLFKDSLRMIRDLWIIRYRSRGLRRNALRNPLNPAHSDAKDSI